MLNGITGSQTHKKIIHTVPPAPLLMIENIDYPKKRKNPFVSKRTSDTQTKPVACHRLSVRSESYDTFTSSVLKIPLSVGTGLGREKLRILESSESSCFL